MYAVAGRAYLSYPNRTRKGQTRGRDVKKKLEPAIWPFPARLMVAQPAKQIHTQSSFINFAPPPSTTAPIFRK